jgi:hypothetical protein
MIKVLVPQPIQIEAHIAKGLLRLFLRQMLATGKRVI